jgi:hypothetical protein
MIILPLQYGVVGIVGFYDAEPWPAFVFPGFKSVPVVEGAFETEQKVFELVPKQNEEEVLLKTPSELFPKIPVSQLSGFIRHNFSQELDAGKISSEGKEWLLQQAEHKAGVKLQKISLLTVLEYRQFKSGEMTLDSAFVVRKQTILGDFQ